MATAATRPRLHSEAMNYLAHAWLARHSDDAILGALLGDFVFGQLALADWPEPVRAEIIRHRRIDRYTDAHPAVVAARARFGALRRYAGIALDVYFDHCLARDWSRWSEVPLDAFSARVYRILNRRRDALPARLGALLPHMIAQDWLGSYRQRASVDRAVRGIATRLSRNGDRLVDCLAVLRREAAAMDATFAAFFPDLVAATAVGPDSAEAEQRARTGDVAAGFAVAAAAAEADAEAAVAVQGRQEGVGAIANLTLGEAGADP